MARCDIPAQVWALFSTAPNLRGLFWTCIGLRGLLYATSLHLDLTNCSPSHNTLSAFNYCLEGSGLRVTHSTGSLCGSVGAACVRVSIECAECPLYDDRGIEGSAEFHCAFSFFISPPPRSSRIAQPRPQCKWLREQPPGKYHECAGAVIVSV